MALHEALRELVVARGVGVLADGAELRAAMDDFLTEDEISAGELNLLTDAVRLGAVQRLVALLDHGAEPEAAVSDSAATLARDRGTDDVRSARWAVSLLGFALGRLPEPAAHDAGSAPAPEPRVDRPELPPGLAPPVPAPLAPAAPRRRRTWAVLVAVALVTVVGSVGGVVAAMLWGPADESADPDQDGRRTAARGAPLAAHELLVGGAIDGDSRIYRVDVRTGEAVAITQGPGDRHPTITPDRSTAVYMDGPTKGPFVAMAIDLKTEKTQRLFSPDGPCGNSLRPSWSPSGDRLAVFCTGDDNIPDGLYVGDADGKDPQLVIAGQLFRGTPTWVSEDTLVYPQWDFEPEQEPSSLWTLTLPEPGQAEQPTPTELAVDVGRTDVSLSHPDWSPDNERLLFLVQTWTGVEPTGVEEPREVWTAAADGTDARPEGTGPYDAPVWSPDGTQVAVVRLVGDGFSDLAVGPYPSDGEKPVPLALSVRVRFFGPVWGSR